MYLIEFKHEQGIYPNITFILILKNYTNNFNIVKSELNQILI